MTDVATIAREAALPLEVKKDGLSQRQDGSWIIRFRCHPNDMQDALARAPMGTRYMLALVEIGDNEEPKTKAPVNPLVQRCAILCGDEEFNAFLKHTYPLDWQKSDEDAAIMVRGLLEVQSRRELATNARASAAFEEMLRRFEGWKRGYE